ncbi:MAG: hypothetical protein IPO91_21810 [Chloroflexi bacterium]|nr:hypothetical protein [Chloroflexota bacterium]
MSRLLLVVQDIRVTWTKASRGGVNAGRRNAVPHALPLTDLPPLDKTLSAAPLVLIHQQYRCTEAADFQMPPPLTTSRAIAAHDKVSFPGTRLKIAPTAITVIYRYTWSGTGAPTRYPVARSITLAAGQWGQVQFNGRFGWDAPWTYHLTTLNIGLFTHIELDVFVRTTPHKTLFDRADLW